MAWVVFKVVFLLVTCFSLVCEMCGFVIKLNDKNKGEKMESISLYKNSNLQSILQADIENNMLNHAYLLYGQNEEVLNGFAVQMAKHILCEQGSPCDICDVCDNIEKNIYSDVAVYPKKSNVLKTEDANEIADDSLVVPFEAEHKIYILKGFDKATISAQNKLLKTLEEPNKYVVFILTTNNLAGVLATIRSRSKKLYVQTTGEEDNESVIGAQELANDIFLNMKSSKQVLEFGVKLQQQDIVAVLTQMQSLLVLAMDELQQNKPKTMNDAVIRLTADFTILGLKKIFEASLQLQKELQANANKNMSIEHFLMKILEVRFECQQ